jgi:translation initiation factor IF-3
MPARRPRREPAPDINERLLRLDDVRLIDEHGGQAGVVSAREALNRAREASLDLVLVAAHADPPVVKITDYGRHKYEQSKLKKDKKPKGQSVKGIKVSPNIAEHDLQVMTRRAYQFLSEGDKVRVVCRFRQRELAYPDVGRKKMQTLIEAVDEVGKPDKEPILNGREMVVVINPKPAGKAKDAKTQDTQDGGEEV